MRQNNRYFWHEVIFYVRASHQCRQQQFYHSLSRRAGLCRKINDFLLWAASCVQYSSSSTGEQSLSSRVTAPSPARTFATHDDKTLRVTMMIIILPYVGCGVGVVCFFFASFDGAKNFLFAVPFVANNEAYLLSSCEMISCVQTIQVGYKLFFVW